MSKRLVIVDTAFSEGEGHHLAANELLTAAARISGFEEVHILCQSRSPFQTIADGQAKIIPTFKTTPYALFKAGDLRRLAVLDRNARADFDAIPQDTIQDHDLLLVHTINEVQFLALAQWLVQVLDRHKSVRVRLALMFPVGLEFSKDTVSGVRDAATAMIFKHGTKMLEPFSDRIEWMGIGRSVAKEFHLLTGADVSYAPALVPNIGVPLGDKPETDTPNIVLYVGDAKFDKGFHHLPGIIERLRKSDRKFRAIVQVSGSVIQNYPGMRRALETAVQGDARFDMRNGRMSNEAYQEVWQNGHVALLGYDPQAYRYKSSGLCWETINYAVPAVVMKDSFHHREIHSYGLEPVVVEEYWPDALFAGLEEALDRNHEMLAKWSRARADFVSQNRPELYYTDPGKRRTGPGSMLDLSAHVPDWQMRVFDALFA